MLQKRLCAHLNILHIKVLFSTTFVFLHSIVVAVTVAYLVS